MVMKLTNSVVRKYYDIKEIIVVTKDDVKHKVKANECIIISTDKK